MEHMVPAENVYNNWTAYIVKPILCINIAVLLRYMSHNRPVPCNELYTVVALLEDQ